MNEYINIKSKDNLFKASYISKLEIFNRVWRLYRGEVPQVLKSKIICEERHEVCKYSKRCWLINKSDSITKDQCELETDAKRIMKEFADEMKQNRDDYEKYKDKCYKYLKEVLTKINSPLLIYTNVENYHEVPVIVGAMFAAIMNAVKGEDLTADALINRITVDINAAGAYNFTDNVFLMDMAESLRAFYGMSSFDSFTKGPYYAMIIDGRSVMVNGTNRTSQINADGEIFNVYKKTVSSIIRNFTVYYRNTIEKQADLKNRANIRLQNELRLLNPDDRDEDLMAKMIKREVFYAYGLNANRADELEKIFPLDFTEPKYDDYFCFRNAVDKQDFYAVIYNTEDYKKAFANKRRKKKQDDREKNEYDHCIESNRTGINKGQSYRSYWKDLEKRQLALDEKISAIRQKFK